MLAKRAIAANAHLLPIDRSDPTLILYLPFWYPHGDMTGNPIYSYDIYRHSCTVSGATWGSTGRTFNPATPDYIELSGDTSIMNFTSGDFTIIANVYVTDTSSARMIFNRGLYQTDGYFFDIETGGQIRFFTNQAAADQSTVSNAGAVSVNTRYSLGLARSGANANLYRNGVDVTAAGGGHINPATCARTLKIGIWDGKATEPMSGIFNALLAWSRCLPASEIANISNAIMMTFN